MGYIYKIINTVNNKIYIGQTIQLDINKRWAAHKNAVTYNKGCPKLTAAFKKYGFNKFKFEIIIICFDSAVYELEKYYIKKYNAYGENGYNSTEGGEPGGFFKGHKHSDESINKIKNTLNNYYKNEEIRKETSLKVKIALSKINMSEVMKNIITQKKEQGLPIFKNRVNGINLSDDVKDKIRKSVLQYYENNKSKNINRRSQLSKLAIERIGRQINQYELNGKFIAKFKCIKEAADKTNINRKSIQNAVGGVSKTSGGFIWKYISRHDTINSFFKIK